jgi:hypothetical protein
MIKPGHIAALQEDRVVFCRAQRSVKICATGKACLAVQKIGSASE